MNLTVGGKKTIEMPLDSGNRKIKINHKYSKFSEMNYPINYFLDHTTASVELLLTSTNFISKTQGKGVLDRPIEIDIALKDLKSFCLVPTTKFQNLENVRTKGDHSYDSEFIFSYLMQGRIKTKRVFVNSREQSFLIFINELQRLCPEAGLLNISPAEAMKKMGVLGAKSATKIIIVILVSAAIIATLVYFSSKF